MEPDYDDLKDFAKWVAREIFDPLFDEHNHYAFVELACRRLNKLGIVGNVDNNWVFVDEDDAEA